MKVLKRVTTSLLNIGIDDQVDPSMVKNIQVVNALGTLAIASHLSSIPMTVLYIEYSKPAIAVLLLMVTLMSLTLFLNHKKKHYAAIILGGLAAINNVTLYTLLLGTKSNIHFLMPAVMIGAFYYFPYKRRVAMFALIALSLVAFFSLEIWFFSRSPLLLFPDHIFKNIVLFVNLMIVVTIFGFMYYGYVVYEVSETNLTKERAKSENLLLNILPAEIAQRLKNGEERIADRHETAAVLFLDMANFTVLSERIGADELVALLDAIFTEFDLLVEESGAEKIKTIGDCYMVATGIVGCDERPVETMVDLALELNEVSKDFFARHNLKLQPRIGVSCGPVVAGVIGHNKYAYDLWGDTVNVASRMESHGEPEKVHVSEAVYDLLKAGYDFTCRGEIEIKGKGAMRTYFVNGKKDVSWRASATGAAPLSVSS